MPEGVPVQPGSDDLKRLMYRDDLGRLLPCAMLVVQDGGDGSAAVPVSSASPLPAGSSASYVFSGYQASLADAAEIDSGWIDLGAADKIQVEITASAPGLTMLIETSSEADGTGGTVTTTTPVEQTFYLFNVIVRQRYVRYRVQNGTGGALTDVSLALKATFGSSDKLSVFPLSVSPSDFSQAALVQSVSKAQQPDGDYVNAPADGEAFSTAALLAGDGVFLSSWVDSDGWSGVELFVAADQASVEGGVEVEFTDDANAGSPTVRAVQSYTFGADDISRGFLVIRFATVLDGFRVRYTNGSTGQGAFFLAATLKVAVAQPPGQVLEDDVGPETISPITRAVLAGRDPAGLYRNIFASNDGALLISQFLEEVGRGNIPGHSSLTKFGRSAVIGMGGSGDIWAAGGIYTGQPASNAEEVIRVTSGSADDTAAGTGMRTIRIFGLKSPSSTAIESEDITLNGTGNALSAGTWYRVFRAFGLTYGSGGTNAGAVTIQHNVTTANIFAVLTAGVGQTQVAAFTVPAQSTCDIVSVYIKMTRTSGAAGSANVALLVREPGQGGYNAKRNWDISNGGPVDPPFRFRIANIPPGSDVKVRAFSVSDNGTTITADIEAEFIAV